MCSRLFRYLLLLAVLLPFPMIFFSCSGATVSLIAIQVDPLCTDNVPSGGAAIQFNACLFVDDQAQGYQNNAVSWSVLGGDLFGTVTQDGLYTPPGTNPPPASEIVIIATSKEDAQKQGQATVVMDVPNATPCPTDLIPSACF